jgi:low affinity Fe/Cu permease
MDRIFTRVASLIAGLAGQPAAFLLAFSVVLVWG